MSTRDMRAALIGCLVVQLAWIAPVTISNAAAEVFAGKRIQMVIGWDVGGGYDVYARLLARHIGKYIPGNPTIVPQNMPGAGSRLAANWLYSVAPKDGTAIATIGQGTPLDQAMNEPGVRYDAAKLGWIGNPIIDNLVTAVSQQSGVNTLDDLQRKGGLYCGDVGAGPTSTFPEILNHLLGTRNKLIPGFPGVNAVYLAMERGEVDCIGGTTWSSMKATRGAKLQNHEIPILLQWGTQKDPEISSYMKREIPLILDIARNDLDRKALSFIASSATLGRPFAAPPGLPEDRLEMFRRAFNATMTDPDFLAEAARGHMDVKPLAGEALQRLATEVAKAPPVELDRARELIGRGRAQ